MSPIEAGEVDRTSIVFISVSLSPDQQWRCAWRGRGFGTVVSQIELLGSVVGYGVELEDGRGAERRALPADVRRVVAPPAPVPSRPRALDLFA